MPNTDVQVCVCVSVCVLNTSVLSWEMLCLTSSVSSKRLAFTCKGSEKHKRLFKNKFNCELSYVYEENILLHFLKIILYCI